MWALNSVVNSRCRTCEQARAGFCKFAWKASVYSSRIARYDSHSREHTLRCNDAGRLRIRLSQDCANLSIYLFLSLSLYIYIFLHSTFNCLCHVGSHLTPYTYIYIRNFNLTIVIFRYLRSYYVSIIQCHVLFGRCYHLLYRR